MSSHADIDALIASLHPHVYKCLGNKHLYTARSLQPSGNSTAFHDIVDSFATLFGLHPECDAAAVTIQTTPSAQRTSLYVCPSPTIPHEFKGNLKLWLDQFIAIRKESIGGALRNSNGEFSRSTRSFILFTYRLCYPAMRDRTMSQEFGIWNMFKPEAEAPKLVSEEEKRLRKELAVELRKLSELAEGFKRSISDQSFGDWGDAVILGFHKSCLTLRDMLKRDNLKAFIEQYIYPEGVDHILVHLCLPNALSTLYSDLSQNPSLPLHDQWLIDVLDLAPGARQFSATVTTAYIAERFIEGPDIKWEDVVLAYQEEVVKSKNFGKGLKWDGQKSLLSTEGDATAHPETELVQCLAENSDVEGEAYIACSRTPCYASVRYVEAVNQAVNTQFTMRTNNADWCRLYTAEPWILPKATKQEVVATMREALLRDLRGLVYRWKNNRLDEDDATEDDADEDDTDEDVEEYD